MLLNYERERELRKIYTYLRQTERQIISHLSSANYNKQEMMDDQIMGESESVDHSKSLILLVSDGCFHEMVRAKIPVIVYLTKLLDQPRNRVTPG